MRAFAHEGAPDFSDKNWLRLIHEGSTKKRLECCTDKDGNLYYSGTLWWYSNKVLNRWNTRLFHTVGNHRGKSWIFQSFFGSGIIPGGKEKDRARQAVFLTPLNPFGKDPEEEEKPHFDYKVHQKVLYETRWKQNRDVRLSESHDCNSGKRSHLQSWLTPQYQETALTLWLLRTEID